MLYILIYFIPGYGSCYLRIQEHTHNLFKLPFSCISLLLYQDPELQGGGGKSWQTGPISMEGGMGTRHDREAILLHYSHNGGGRHGGAGGHRAEGGYSGFCRERCSSAGDEAHSYRFAKGLPAAEDRFEIRFQHRREVFRKEVNSAGAHGRAGEAVEQDHQGGERGVQHTQTCATGTCLSRGSTKESSNLIRCGEKIVLDIQNWVQQSWTRNRSCCRRASWSLQVVPKQKKF